MSGVRVGRFVVAKDSHKIPKWKCRARSGQFVGFSREHSTLVPLIRNLRTGYVLPQYHVVLDEKFDTVMQLPSQEHVVDKICDDLWDSSCKRFADWTELTEYDDDGDLEYTPPSPGEAMEQLDSPSIVVPAEPNSELFCD
ncbi:hypothetical protein THAOC_37847 [Thalassiosira oceanica]|uniref:Uncharacterized protein n=1 Tax=Thalassiosira oceanica TaxID=159749 RepID=K0QZK6_THAOC|nr:hypothetical protein THAOC_37847 [Thalassiosira oceanica]|eukprot:EJK43684.1 hypothetical protein THAOC_37847 [Thalassiosira oceanica]